MKFTAIKPVVAVSALALFLSACGGGDTSVTIAQPQQSGISVNGTVTPDIAVINVGVEVLRPTVAEARDGAADAMTAMHDALTRNGVADEDISTRSFNIYPRYGEPQPCVIFDGPASRFVPTPAPLPAIEPTSGETSSSSGATNAAVAVSSSTQSTIEPLPPVESTVATASDDSAPDPVVTLVAIGMPEPPADEKPVPTLYATGAPEPVQIAVQEKCPPQLPQIVGYTVNNTLSVKVRDLDSLSDVLDDAIGAGGNEVRVQNVSFTVDEPEQYMDEAREQAIIDARERAEQLATLSGATLGSLRSISESSNRGGGVYMEYAMPARADGGDTFLAPGQQDVSLTVYVVYDVG